MPFVLQNPNRANIYIQFHLGASIPCCQGTNPVPQADAICGWWFQIDPKDERGAHAAICGKYTYNDIFEKTFF